MALVEDYNERMELMGTEVRQLFTLPDALAAAAEEAGAAYRGAGEWPVDFLAERSESLESTTLRAGELTLKVLEEGSPSQQEAAEYKLLVQATSQLEVARELLLAAEDQMEQERSGEVPPDMATRSARSYGLVRALDELGAALESPLEIPAPHAVRGVAERPADLDGAKEDLEIEVRLALRQIQRQTAQTGATALRTLLKMNPDVLLEGVKLISKEAAESLDRLIKDASKIIRRIIDSAVRLILQAYDWVLALLGKDAEAAARMKVKEWIDELKKEPGDDEDTLADRLVVRLYEVEVVRQDTSNWLKSTKRLPEEINQIADDVASLANRYSKKNARVESFLNGLSVLRALPIPFIKLPQFQVLLAALNLGLLGYTLYTGYDHVDSGQVTFYKKFGVTIPDRVVGVRATVQAGLVEKRTEEQDPEG